MKALDRSVRSSLIKNCFKVLIFCLGMTSFGVAHAGYPAVDQTYQAPWVDVFSIDSNGIYSCVSGSEGGAEGCAAGRLAASGNTKDLGWSVPSNCFAFNVNDNNCLQG